MINVNVKLFAGAREIAGVATLQLALDDGSNAGAVLAELVTRYPKLKDWTAYLRLAVNQEYVSIDCLLNDRDEVAVIPPVSGG